MQRSQTSNSDNSPQALRMCWLRGVSLECSSGSGFASYTEWFLVYLDAVAEEDEVTEDDDVAEEDEVAEPVRVAVVGMV